MHEWSGNCAKLWIGLFVTYTVNMYQEMFRNKYGTQEYTSNDFVKARRLSIYRDLYTSCPESKFEVRWHSFGVNPKDAYLFERAARKTLSKNEKVTIYNLENA